MIPQYKYQVKDYSVFTPFFRKNIAEPLLRLIPIQLPANIITIISNIFMFTAFTLAFKYGQSLSFNCIIIPFLVFLYLLFDHFDGMQAKRTKTSSALGEFFDHFMDTFNNGILMGLFVFMFEITDIWIIALVMSVSYLTHATVFLEQFKTKWLIFEKYGTFEGIMMVIILLIASYFDFFRTFVHTKIIFGVEIIHIFLLLVAFSEIITLIRTLIRTKSITLKFVMFTILLAIVSVISAILFSEPVVVILLISLYSIYYIGGLQKGHLATTKEAIPDIVLPLLLIVFYLFDFVSFKNGIFILMAYAIALVIYLASSTIYLLRKFWVWKNPLPVLQN